MRCAVRVNRWFLVGAWIPFVFSACSEVISESSDSQAWEEFVRAEGGKRAPASGENELQSRLRRISARDILIACDEVTTREACYREAMARKFDEAYQASVGNPGSLTSQEYRKEQALFLAGTDYSLMLEKLDRFHRELLSGIEITARDRIRRLFAECEKSLDGEARIDRFDLIWGITSEIPKSVYACLVAEWTGAADRVIADAGARLGVRLETQGARAWIRTRQVYPAFDVEISTILRERAAREAAELDKLKPSLRNEIHPFQTDEQALAKFAPDLRKRFPYTQVEQWILGLKNSQK